MMEVSVSKLFDDGVALCRYLTLIGCDWANTQLALAVPDKQAGAFPLGTWRRLRRGSDVGYVYRGKDGEGKYQRDPPEGVDPAQIPTIDVDPTAKPADLLAEQLGEIVDRILGTEGLGVGPSTVLELLRRLLRNARKATAAGYNDRVVLSAAERLRSGLMRDSQAALASQLQAVADEVAQLRMELAADGELTSWFLVYRDLCMSAERQVREWHGAEKAGRCFVGYYAYGCAGLITRPLDLLGGLVAKADREGLRSVVRAAADGYLSKGEKWIEAALASSSIEEFRASLYTAGMYLFAALMIYKVLVGHGGRAGEKPDEYLSMVKHADEKLVRVAGSFQNAVLNRTGRCLAKHQARVAAASKAGGESAADQVVFELTDMYLFYPRFYREVLWPAPRAPGLDVRA